MTEPYVPSLADGQSYYVAGRAQLRRQITGEQALDITPYSREFDRLIEAVRAEERERIAAEIEKGYLGPDFARRPDGSEGPEAYAANAYDEGLEYAARIARGGAS